MASFGLKLWAQDSFVELVVTSKTWDWGAASAIMILSKHQAKFSSVPHRVQLLWTRCPGLARLQLETCTDGLAFLSSVEFMLTLTIGFRQTGASINF